MAKKRKTTLNDLLQGKENLPYLKQAEYIQRLAEAGKIKPISKKETNGKMPPLPLRYWMILEDEKDDVCIDSSKLNPLISLSYYRNHPKDYEREKPFIFLLSEFLKENDLSKPQSENVRSFQIWQQEKGFSEGLILPDQSRLKADILLSHCGIADLNTYKIPYPVTASFPGKGTDILIVENNDPYIKCLQRIREGKTVFGKLFDGIVFGSGNQITGRNIFIDAPENAEYQYWGDLDKKGIQIYLDLCSVGQYPATLFLPPYEAMIDRAISMEKKGRVMPKMPDKQGDVNAEKVRSLFPAELCEYIIDLWRKGRYIPQEIIYDYD